MFIIINKPFESAGKLVSEDLWIVVVKNFFLCYLHYFLWFVYDNPSEVINTCASVYGNICYHVWRVSSLEVNECIICRYVHCSLVLLSTDVYWVFRGEEWVDYSCISIQYFVEYM